MWRLLSLVGLLVVASCATAPKPAPAPAPAPAPVAQPAPAPAPTGGQRAASAWKTNEAGLTIIEEAEGLRLEAYQLAGQWLIGYGHAKGVKAGQTITREQAQAFLQEDVIMCEAVVADSVKVPVTKNEYSAMVSLCYNIGPQSFSRSSVVSKLNGGDRVGAADSFLLWNKATIGGVRQAVPYLTARREKERALFLQ